MQQLLRGLRVVGLVRMGGLHGVLRWRQGTDGGGGRKRLGGEGRRLEVEGFQRIQVFQ